MSSWQMTHDRQRQVDSQASQHRPQHAIFGLDNKYMTGKPFGSEDVFLRVLIIIEDTW